MDARVDQELDVYEDVETGHGGEDEEDVSVFWRVGQRYHGEESGMVFARDLNRWAELADARLLYSVAEKVVAL